LTSHVSDDEILGCLHATQSAQSAATRLTALANARGGSDNITVLIVECGSLRRWPQFARARGIYPLSRRAKRPRHVGWALAVFALGLGLVVGLGHHRGWWRELVPVKAGNPVADGGARHK
jgi:hypothetical protein